MYFQIEKFAVNYNERPGTLVADAPVFTWAARHSADDQHQSAYSLTVSRKGEAVWETGLVEASSQRAVYRGPALESGLYDVTLTIRDRDGVESGEAKTTFRFEGQREWVGKWITTADGINTDGAKYFFKGITLSEKPVEALLFASGIGYQYVTINGIDVEKSFLNPAVSQFDKICYYTVTDVTDALQSGKNGICAILGNGWRSMDGYFEAEKADMGDRLLFGDCRLMVQLELTYADGRKEVIGTDESWLSGYGPIVKNSIFDGEVWDMRAAIPGWDTPDFAGEGFEPSILAKGGVGKLIPQLHEPVRERERLSPKTIHRAADGGYVLDFGVNIAGIGCLKIPCDIAEGTEITLEFAEEILPNGNLDKETLRRAKVVDTFIAGKENPTEWIPRFTYHGFRYAKITGYPTFPGDAMTAIAFSNEVKSRSFFRCGNPLANQIYENILRTELDNLHHLATDCPQRDERMGWMNDATVRFELSPYNCRMGRLFPKIVRDITVEQDPKSGAIYSTAPLIWSGPIADPVCSSYLVAGYQMLLHYGDTQTIAENYEPYKRWNQCLADLCTEEGIVEYSSYGDWAGPADYCDRVFDGCHSIVTPSPLMSTGYHYYNYTLLAKFADLLGKPDEKAEFEAKAAEVREAFLKKWVDIPRGYVHNGSQGAQAFALWLGILPKECEKAAAAQMFDAVKNVGYRLTTGNLTSKYLPEMLVKYGYADAAWKLMTRDEYPSLGYMIQNGATTIWERFEFKRGSGMNSHCHPMYGAVGHFFYADLLGVRPLNPGWDKFVVKPCFPEGLLYAEGQVETILGNIYVRWQNQMGQIDLMVDVPFGATAMVTLPTGSFELTSGWHSLSFEA